MFDIRSETVSAVQHDRLRRAEAARLARSFAGDGCGAAPRRPARVRWPIPAGAIRVLGGGRAPACP